MESILSIRGVSKSYPPRGVKAVFDKAYRAKNSILAVNDVSIEIARGEIYGLLGPNGAGKSTIIKMVTGLIRKDTGKILVAGHDMDSERELALAKIGAIIETPTMFKSMSAIDNLRYFATLSGGIDEDKIASALDAVGLTERARDRLETYSLGMKQRLGIAQAIMSKPELLVLDEPTNGLDPEWIMRIRDSLRGLAKEYGVSILVCSHILGEMQLLCDRVGIIDKGCLLGEVDVEDISKVAENATTIVCYETSDVERAFELIKECHEKVLIKNGKIYVELLESEIPALTKMLVMADINVYSTYSKKRTLEDLFASLVKAKRSEGGQSDAR